MKSILIKSGWLGKNGLDWYSAPDDLGEQIYALVQKLKTLGYEVYLNGDLKSKISADLELHLNRQTAYTSKSKKILIYTEPDFVQPQNIFLPLLNYDITLTLRSDAELNSKNRYYGYPRSLSRIKNPEFSTRDILVSCIAGNKNAVVRSPYNLYPQRQRYIHILNEMIGSRFHLYGGGWDKIDHPIGLFAKAAFRVPAVSRLLKRRSPLISYQGACRSKREVMQRSIFTLCIENTSAPGGMTEKLIDCFQYGSVPLYLGSSDIAEMIPSCLYHRLDEFSDPSALIRFIQNFSANNYKSWLANLDVHFDAISESRSIERYLNTVIDAVQDTIGIP